MVGSCQFALAGLMNDDRDDRFAFGFFNFENNNEVCERFDQDVDQPGMKAGRLFAVVQSLVMSGVLVATILLFLVLSVKREAIYRAIQIALYFCLWCQFFAFFILEVAPCKAKFDGVELNCKLGAAGIVAVFNVLLLIGLVVLSFFVVVPSSPVFGHGSDSRGGWRNPTQTAAASSNKKAIEKHEETEKIDHSERIEETAAGPFEFVEIGAGEEADTSALTERGLVPES